MAVDGRNAGARGRLELQRDKHRMREIILLLRQLYLLCTSTDASDTGVLSAIRGWDE
jgi:hypothetical protein